MTATITMHAQIPSYNITIRVKKTSAIEQIVNILRENNIIHEKLDEEYIFAQSNNNMNQLRIQEILHDMSVDIWGI
jgi:hypothetical protein